MDTPKPRNEDYILIEIEKSAFVDFVWMSSRYCIPRHTISSSFHAQDIWKVVCDNPGCMSETRMRFEARDIRENISDTMRWHPNIEVHNEYNDRNRMDAYTLYLDYRLAHPDCDPKKTKFYIDCENCTVEAEPWENDNPNRLPFEDNMDLEPWCKLAACLNGEFYDVHVEYKGKSYVKKCIRTLSVNHYQGANEVEERYCHPDSWNSFVAPEYITKVAPASRPRCL